MIAQNEILKNLGVEELNPMQLATLEAFGVDKNLVLLSPTGSGKTLAFLLPLVQRLDAESNDVQAVILAPSRELALQIETVFKQMGTPFKVMSCYGGRPAMDEHRTMNGIHPQVIVGTPGRMNDHLEKRNFNAKTVTTLVIDEFDKCLEFGFQEEMSEVIGKLPSLKKRVLLSATNADEIPQFTGVATTEEGKLLKNKVIKLDFSQSSYGATNLLLQVVNSPIKDKLETLYRLLCQLGNQTSLVFVNYRESVERVTGYLQAKRFPCDMFHGGMEQDDRERSLYKFRNGTCPVLISTDLAARGLDIPGIDNVIHYHLPVNEESFTHRNGRTARWDATGQSFMILGPEEQLPDYVDANVSVFDLPENTPMPPKQEWATYKKGCLDRNDVGQVDVKDHYAFVAVKRSKVNQLLKLVAGEKIKGMRTIIEEAI